MVARKSPKSGSDIIAKCADLSCRARQEKQILWEKILQEEPKLACLLMRLESRMGKISFSKPIEWK